MRTAGTWDPDQYDRFAAEREQPFWDLAALLAPVEAPRLADLGCGDGRLTVALHARLGCSETVGGDTSREMLARAADRAGGGVRFEEGDIGAWGSAPVDIVFANASLHWVPDHRAVLRRWLALLAPGGQLAVQVPTN